MRSLKFRAWSNEHNRYCDFVTLDENGRWIGWIKNSGVYLTTADIVLEQDTGLRDKNGKDIYEGDVISFENEKGLAKVLWLDGKAMFGLKWLDCGVEDELDYWNVCRGPAEVIGNIHEYPELLEGEKMKKATSVSLCRNCWCMTHTLVGNVCGKCMRPKHIIDIIGDENIGGESRSLKNNNPRRPRNDEG